MTPERKEKIEKVLRYRQPDLSIILENVHDPGNVSAVMRTCDAIGVQEVFVLNTRMPSHTWFGRKTSGGASHWLTIRNFENTEACMEAVRKRYQSVFAAHLDATATGLYNLDLTSPVALVFGNEHEGVSAECLTHCDGSFMIPQVGMVQSLNISVACAVSLYEAFRQRQAKGYYNGEGRLSATEKAGLSRQWGIYEETNTTQKSS